MVLLQNATEPFPGAASLGAWGVFALLFVAAAVAALFFERIVVASMRALADTKRNAIAKILVDSTHRSLAAIVFVLWLWLGINYLGSNLPVEVTFWTKRLGLAVVAVLFALVLSRVFSAILRHRASNRVGWKNAASLGGRLFSLVVYIVAFLILLDYYGLSITPLLTGLGLAGLAVALALQDTLSNFFAGIWIQTGRALREGHFVRVEDGNVEGTVEEIGWRTTSIRTLFNSLVLIPNAKLAQSVVTDYHLPEPRLAVFIPIGVSYDSDPKHVERVLLAAVEESMDQVAGLIREPKPFVRFHPGFGDYALQFQLVVYVREYGDQFGVQSEVRRRILDHFQREGIRIPYPTTVQIRQAPD